MGNEKGSPLEAHRDQEMHRERMNAARCWEIVKSAVSVGAGSWQAGRVHFLGVGGKVATGLTVIFPPVDETENV